MWLRVPSDRLNILALGSVQEILPALFPRLLFCPLQGPSRLLDLLLAALASPHPLLGSAEDLSLGLDVVIPPALGSCTDGDDLGVFVKDADECGLNPLDLAL